MKIKLLLIIVLFLTACGVTPTPIPTQTQEDQIIAPTYPTEGCGTFMGLRTADTISAYVNVHDVTYLIKFDILRNYQTISISRQICWKMIDGIVYGEIK
jgi:hypothetical protein